MYKQKNKIAKTNEKSRKLEEKERRLEHRKTHELSILITPLLRSSLFSISKKPVRQSPIISQREAILIPPLVP